MRFGYSNRWDRIESNTRVNHGLHPTRLSPLEIGGSTRLQWVLWRRFLPAPVARVKPVPLGASTLPKGRRKRSLFYPS